MASAAASWIGNKAFKPTNQNKALVRSTRQGHYALRPLPNEDIALWVKSIDNSRVAQQRDPKVNGALWRYIGGAVACGWCTARQAASHPGIASLTAPTARGASAQQQQ